MKPTKSTSLSVRLALVLALLLIILLAVSPLISTRAVAADAPPTTFSAVRAYQDLQEIAREPHQAGSPAQARVTDYIVIQVAEAGLNAEFQESGQIKNILVRIPGSDSTGTILITAHYDSHQNSPGAGDDGVSAAAMLETIRALGASNPLRNDLLFLFSDGEELGYVGAKTFLSTYPDAKQAINVVICFDARPGNAPITLRHTTVGDAWLVRNLTGLRFPMWASSWTNIVERSDIDTDFTMFAMAGFTGIEIENETMGDRYHTPRDTVEAVSPHLLQAYGKTMVLLANRFGDIDLRNKYTGDDLTFFTIPIFGLVAYPKWVMPILAWLGVFLFVGIAVMAWRKKQFSLLRFLLGILALLVSILVLVLISEFLWKRILEGRYANFEGSHLWALGLLVLVELILIGAIAFLSRRTGAVNLAIAGIILYEVIWGVAYYKLDALNPMSIPYLAWAFLGGVASLATILFVKAKVWNTVLLALAALLTLTLGIPVIWFSTMVAEEFWTLTLGTSVLVCLLVPQIATITGQAEKSGQSTVNP